MILKYENYKENGKILIKKCRKIKITKNMPVKIRLPWKRQVVWAKACQIKMSPDKF